MNKKYGYDFAAAWGLKPEVEDVSYEEVSSELLTQLDDEI